MGVSFPVLIFIMALQAPEASKDWQQVSRLCERTLRSVCAQSCTDFRVFLVCNQRPELTFAHPALTIIEEEFPAPACNTPSRMRDRWSKLKRGLIAARQHAPAHIMIMDADDCVHHGLAALASKSPNAPGWIFNVGYLHDTGTRWVFRWGDFDKLCGTSAIVRLESRDFPTSMSEANDRFFILSNGHGEIGEFLNKRGTPLVRLPFVGAIYNTATGENDSGVALSKWKGKRMLLKKVLTGQPLTRRIREEFGFYELS